MRYSINWEVTFHSVIATHKPFSGLSAFSILQRTYRQIPSVASHRPQLSALLSDPRTPSQPTGCKACTA